MAPLRSYKMQLELLEKNQYNDNAVTLVAGETHKTKSSSHQPPNPHLSAVGPQGS